MSYENDLFYDFLHFKERKYYHQGDSYGEYSGNWSTFLQDIRDYQCHLYLISYGSGYNDFMMGTDRDKEDRVLEDFYEMLLESGEFSSEENDDNYIFLEGISCLDMSTFIEVESSKFDTVELQSYLGKYLPTSFDDLENYLEDNTDFYEGHSFNSKTTSYGVEGYIELAEVLAQDLVHPSVTRLTSVHNDKNLFIMLQDKYSTYFLDISPKKDFFTAPIFNMLFSFMEESL